jgi:WD40 repeat protein/serine/threonine protein kinase
LKPSGVLPGIRPGNFFSIFLERFGGGIRMEEEKVCFRSAAMPTANREEALFAAALEKPTRAERAAYLDGACGDDLALRARLEALLAAHDASGGVLDAPPPVLSPTTAYSPLTEGPGTVIGPYKLLQQIGEGGMGVVYMAEQEQPVRRKVALKIIKPGMDSRQVIARFEVERQALAMMDHQNIARVLGADTTDSGRPYFVMELVHGVPITQFCDDNKLTLRERLELFVPVCQAIQHAHQKGIIHRDIKPSNVLVTMYDDKPVAKVIDFGLAKAIEQRLTEKTMFTQFGALVGTFEYMSPEQAEMNAFGVDTRSDIYALGVLLYELLTGTTPVERKRLREAALDELVRLIKEEEAPPPSKRLSSSNNLPKIAAARKTEPARLSKLVRGDIDWIVMKCLEKDRSRRYDTASGLARDLEHYLADEPVQACPPSTGYRLRKFLRRHRLPVLAAALLLLTLLAGVIGTTAGLLQAVAARDDEVRQRKDAEAARKEVEDQRDAARFQARRAESARHAIQIEQAQRAWERGEVGTAERLLSEVAEPFRQTWEQRYLRALCRRKAMSLLGQDGYMANVAMSADGRLIVSANADTMLKVWDAVTGKERLTLKGHTGPVWCVAVSADGRRIVSGSDDRTVRVWDGGSGKTLFTLEGHKGAIDAVALSADGRLIVSADVDAAVKTWDAATGKLIRTKEGLPGNGVAVSADGRLVARGEDTPVVWEAATGAEMPSFKDPVGSITSLAFTPDGRRIVSATYDCAVQVWDLKTGKVQRRWVIPPWQIRQRDPRERGGITRVAVSGDGKRVIAAGWGQTAKVWDLETGEEKFSLQGHTGRGNVCRSVAISANGRRIVTANDERDIQAWDLLAGPESRTLQGHLSWIAAVALSADGHIAVSGGGAVFGGGHNGAEVKVWDVDTGEVKHNLLVPHSVRAVAISRDGRQVVCGSDGGTIRAWDARTGREQYTRKAHTEDIRAIAISPDGRRIASASRDHTVKVWDTDTGQERLTYRGHTGEGQGVWDIGGVCFSPDGRLIASGSDIGFVRVWDVNTGEEKLAPMNHKDFISCVAWSADGQYIVSGGRETIKIWNAVSGKEERTLIDHANWCYSLCVSPDGRRIISSGIDTVKLWDVETGEQELSLAGHADTVAGVAISADGRRIVSGSHDQTVKVWEAPLPEQ